MVAAAWVSSRLTMLARPSRYWLVTMRSPSRAAVHRVHGHEHFFVGGPDIEQGLGGLHLGLSGFEINHVLGGALVGLGLLDLAQVLHAKAHGGVNAQGPAGSFAAEKVFQVVPIPLQAHVHMGQHRPCGHAHHVTGGGGLLAAGLQVAAPGNVRGIECGRWPRRSGGSAGFGGQGQAGIHGRQQLDVLAGHGLHVAHLDEPLLQGAQIDLGLEQVGLGGHFVVHHGLGLAHVTLG